MNINFIKAANMLGQVEYREIVRWAQAELAEPIDEGVLQVALCDETDSDCISYALSTLFSREGVDGMTIAEAINCYAVAVCEDIANGVVDPIKGSEKLSKVAIGFASDDFHDLDPFVYASSEVESRPQDREFFESAIRREAKSFCQGSSPASIA